MKGIRQFFILICVSLLVICKTSFALPFSLTPVFLPTQVEQGFETLAYYRVTNITSQNSPNNFVKFMPPYVTQGVSINPNVCGLVFSLAPGQSCLLKLVVAGPVNPNDPSPQHHLFV